MLNKKAISPLIATVLLIGFTIALAGMVMYWYGGIVREQALKQGAANEIRTSCAAQIEIDVDKAIMVTGKNEVEITIKNMKNNLVNGLLIRITGETGTQAKKEKQSLAALEQKIVKVAYDAAKVGTPKYIEVMPMIVRQGLPGTCSEKLIKYKLQQ